MYTSYARSAALLMLVASLSLGTAASATPGQTGIASGSVAFNPTGTMPNAADLFDVSALTPSDAWAVGETQSRAALVEHWDGQSWSSAPILLTDANAVSARTPTDVWAVGYGNGEAQAQHWDGTAWTLSPTLDVDGIFEDVDALSATDVWAVGHEFHGRRTKTLIEHWDGSTWTRQASDPPGVKGSRYLYSVSAVSPTDVWAVGDSQNNPIVEHWDGQAWRDVKTPHLPTPYFLDTVSATAPNDVWAVGSLSVGFPVLDNTLAMHWNGHKWSEVSTPAQPDQAYFNDVAMVASDDVWAVGQTLIPDGQRVRTLVEHWDGTSWRQVRCPNPTKTMDNTLSAVGFDSSTDAWTVGTTYATGKERSLVLHWDGAHWTK